MMKAPSTHLRACAAHFSCVNDEPITATELLTAVPHLSASTASAQFVFLDLNRDLILPTIAAMVSIAAGSLRRLAVYDQDLQICRPLPPGTLSSFTFDSLTELEWTVGFRVNVFNLRLFMDLLPLLPRLRRLSIGPDPDASFAYLQSAADHSPVSFAVPQAGYPFSLTSFTSNFVLNASTLLLIITSSASTLKRLSLQVNSFELSALIPHLPQLPAVTDLSVLTANRLIRRDVSELLLRRCPRAERVHLRTNFEDMFEVEAVARAELCRLRALKLSSLNTFSFDGAATGMARTVREAMPKLRRIDLVAPYFEPADLALFRRECTALRIVLREHTMRGNNDLLTM